MFNLKALMKVFSDICKILVKHDIKIGNPSISCINSFIKTSKDSK